MTTNADQALAVTDTLAQGDTCTEAANSDIPTSSCPQPLNNTFRRVSNDVFAVHFKQARDATPIIRRNTSEKLDFTDHECWLSADNQTGAAFHPETSELMSVFSTNRQGEALIVFLTTQYDYMQLNCYAGFLSDFYAKFGFRVVSEQPNWNGENEPSIVYMEYSR